MPHKGQELIIQNSQISTALSTLASKSAIGLASGQTLITATFLAKKIKYFLVLEGITASEGPFAVCAAHGDASGAEAGSAIAEANTAGPDDLTQVRSQDNVWNIVQNSLKMMNPQRAAGEDAWLEAEISLGKGIPFVEGAGWEFFLINLDASALTTGAIIKGLIQVWGVWLRD